MNVLSLGIFIGLTLAYTFFDFILVRAYSRELWNDPIATKKKRSGIKMFLYVALVATVIGSQIWINSATSNCDKVPLFSIIIHTIIPNLVIFVLMIGLMEMFPAFLEPFSNFIGYGVARVMGVNKILLDILQPEGTNQDVNKIYTDKSMMVNELNENNFKSILESFDKDEILLPGKINDEKLIRKLYNIVAIKNSISRLLWFLLLGSLVVMISSNAIAKIECVVSIDADKKKKMREDTEKLSAERNKKFKNF